jgi:hypothetical protein
MRLGERLNGIQEVSGSIVVPAASQSNFNQIASGNLAARSVRHFLYFVQARRRANYDSGAPMVRTSL